MLKMNGKFKMNNSITKLKSNIQKMKIYIYLIMMEIIINQANLMIETF